MAKIDLTSSEWCQLIFEGKNQAYGAYKMRANSTKRHNLAMFAVLVIALIGFTIPTLLKLATPKQKEVMTEVTTLSKLAEPESLRLPSSRRMKRCTRIMKSRVRKS